MPPRSWPSSAARPASSRASCPSRRGLGGRRARAPTGPSRPTTPAPTSTATTSWPSPACPPPASRRRRRQAAIGIARAHRRRARLCRRARRRDVPGAARPTGPPGSSSTRSRPRVHNSGHWTIEGATTSQFAQHVRAVCGWPLGDPARVGGMAVEMHNLIGDDVDAWAAILGRARRAAPPLRQGRGPAGPQDGPRHPAAAETLSASRTAARLRHRPGNRRSRRPLRRGGSRRAIPSPHPTA